MQGIFHPHPYSTTVGLLTERATDSGQTSEDWSLILEVCDTINESDEGPKDAARAIRKRFTSSVGKDHICVWYTLLLLEACVKNCGRRFHSQVANKEFLHDFLKILSPKNEPSQELQNKVLFMLKSWVECNWEVPGRRDLEKVYTTLLRRGIHFPKVNPDMTTLIPNGKPLKTNGTCTHVLSTVTGHRPSSCRSKSVSCRHSMQSGERQTRSCNKTIVPSNACNVCCTRRTSTASDTQSIPPVAQSDQLPYYSGMNACIRTVQEAQPHACSNRLLFHYPRSNHSSRSVQQFSRNVLVQSVPNSSVGVEHAYRTVRSVPSDRMEFDLDGTVRHLTSAQRVKLMQDLSVVETNVNLLNDMLAELRPDTVGLDDLTLLQELHQTCQAMHLRVMEFLGQVSDEEATPTLLQVSDNLNSAFMRYERFERYRSRSTQSESVSSDSLDLSRSGGGPLPIMYSHEKPLLALTSKDSRESPRLPLALTSRSDQLDDDDDPLLDLTDASNRPSHSNLVSAEQVADWIAARQADESVRNVDHIARAMDRLALVPACVPPAHSSSCTSQKQYFRAVNSTDSVSTTGAAFTAPSATTSSTVSGGMRSKSSTSADLFQL